MNNRNKNYIFYLFLFILILYLGMEILIPLYVEKQVERELTNHFDDYDNIEVEVNSFPPWELLFSMADRVKIKADLLNYEGIVLKDIAAYYQNIIIDDGEIRGKNTDLFIKVTEDDLNNYIQDNYSGLDNFDIHLEEDNAFMKGYINILDRKINLRIDGKFEIREPEEIVFLPQNVKIENLTISKDVIDNFIKDSGYVFDLSQLNFPVRVDNIILKKNELYLISGIFAERAGLNEK
ncbi:MAG: DUF2993 domain-containing protein [Bacillota bacterium]